VPVGTNLGKNSLNQTKTMQNDGISVPIFLLSMAGSGPSRFESGSVTHGFLDPHNQHITAANATSKSDRQKYCTLKQSTSVYYFFNIG
jgi:hypothetical protein